MYARGMEMNVCALNVQIRGRGMYLANPTLCRDSKFHHWNSSPQLNSTPPRSVPTRSVEHADTPTRYTTAPVRPVQVFEMHTERERVILLYPPN